MEEYFLRAIQLAFDPLTDNNTKREADVYLQDLQTTNEGWNLCQTLLSLPRESVPGRLYHTFWAFQLIVNQLPVVRSRMSVADVVQVYGWVRNWIVNICCHVAVPPFIRNKCAQAMVVYLQLSEPSAWTDFFQDTFLFLDIACSQRVQVVELWLRFLQCIDERVVDRDQPRTRDEHQRDTLIKDTMRDCVIERAVQIWFQILGSAHENQPDIARLCLEVVEPYICWIDITLVSTNDWVDMLYFFFRKTELQVQAADCMIQLAEKKMSLSVKKDLIVQLRLLDALPHISPIAVEIVSRLGDDEAFPGKVTDLAVCVGVLLCEMTETGSVPDSAPMCTHMCDVVLPLFSANAALSEKAYEFLQKYLQLLKRGLIVLHPPTIAHMVKSVHVRCLLPSTPPESERIFSEYRKTMFNLLRSVCGVAKEGCFEITLSMLGSVQQQGRGCSVQMAEGVLRIVYELGEGMRPEAARDPSGIRALVDAVLFVPFLEHPDPLVHGAYFEVLDRYAVCFCQGGPAIGVILQSFLEHRNGVRHPVDAVRYRICYLFSRMCGTLRMPFSSDASRIMGSLTFVLSGRAAASSEDKTCLFEGLGVVLWHDEHGLSRLRDVVNAVVENTQSVMSGRGGMSPQDVVSTVVGNISALVGLTKTIGSTEVTHMALLHEVTDFVTNTVLKPMSDSIQVRDKVLSYYQQYINSAASECIPSLSCVLPFLLASANGYEFSKIIRLCTQIVQRTKSLSIECVGLNLVAIVAIVPTLVTDECTDPMNVAFMEDYKGMLDVLKSYFSLLYNLGQYDCLSAVRADTMSQHMSLLLSGVVTHPEFDVSRMCLQVLTKLAQQVDPSYIPMEDVAVAIMKQLTAPYFNARDGKSYTLLLDAVTVLHTIASLGGRDARALIPALGAVVGPQRAADIAQALLSAKDPTHARQCIVEILWGNTNN